MSHNPEEHDEFDYSGEYDPFTSRGPEYDEAWAPLGDCYERTIVDRYSRSFDFADLDYADDADEAE